MEYGWINYNIERVYAFLFAVYLSILSDYLIFTDVAIIGVAFVLIYVPDT